MPIIGRKYRTYATPGICHSIDTDDCLVCRAEFIPPCIPDSHLYRVINTRCRIGTIFSPDDGHTVARNMYRKAMNILRKFVHHVGSIYKITSFSFHITSLFVITDWRTKRHMCMIDHRLKFYFRGHVFSLIITFLPKAKENFCHHRLHVILHSSEIFPSKKAACSLNACYCTFTT